MTVALVINRHSGKGTDPHLVEDEFAKAGVLVAVYEVGDERSPLEAARQAVRDGAETIVAAGGDGTVSAVASVAVEHDRTIGVVPIGTLNHFALDLGIPLEVPAAVRIIESAKTKEVDVGELNGRVFVNNSSLGVYPQVVQLRERQQRRGWAKWTAFFWAVWATIERIPFLAVRLTAEAAAMVHRTPLVFVGNNDYALSGLRAGTRECMTGGNLCLHVVKARSGWELVRRSFAILLGLARGPDEIESLQTREAWVESRRRDVDVSLDGEVVAMEPPLHYRILPRALRVIVP